MPEEDSQRLMAALPWNARKTQIEPVLRSATLALRGLARLDEIIFERRTGSGGLVVDMLARTRDDVDGKAERFLRAVARQMWRGANELIAVVQSQLEAHLEDDPSGDVDLDDFDFDLTGPIKQISEIGEGDIEEALSELATPEAEEMVSLAEVARATVPLVRALKLELASAKAQLLAALETKDFALAVQVLDRTRDGLEEATFAVVEVIFDLHHAPLSRGELVPGYQSALDEALALRRDIAKLRRGVSRENAQLKEGDASARLRVRKRLAAFMKAPAFSLMRAADRMQLLELRRQLAAGDAHVVEGLSKYLDSLSAINDREVLVQHDRRTREEAAEHLVSARSLFEISPRAAAEQVGNAYAVARRLEGWRDDLDALLASWFRDPQRRLDEETAEVWADKLVPLL